MKAAWLGVVGTIVGALIGILGAPHYNAIVNGPPEGVFSAVVSSIDDYQIPAQLRAQIKEYPCTLKIRHIEGPQVEGLSVTIISDNVLTGIETMRNDENVIPKMDPTNKKMTLSIPILRKNSAIEIGFKSIGSPKLGKNIVMSRGRLFGEEPIEKRKPWYKSDYVVIPGFLTGMALSVFVLFYVLRRYAEPYITSASNDRFSLYAAVAAATVLVPVYWGIASMFIIYALVKILKDMEGIKKAIAQSKPTQT